MTRQKREFMRKGIFSILISAFYLIIRDDGHKPILQISTKTSYKKLIITEHNYREIITGHWLLIIDFKPSLKSAKTYNILNRYTNIAYLHVNGLFTSKLAAIFKPSKLKSVYIVKNKWFWKSGVGKMEINFKKRLDEAAVFNYFFYLVERYVDNVVYNLVDEYMVEIVMWFLYFVANVVVS